MEQKSIYELLSAWGVEPNKINALLPGNHKEEHDERKRHILSIHECLTLICRNEEEQRSFLLRPSKVILIEGRKPIELISSGKLDDLALVHRSIRSQVCI
ncbi:hypothetical protein [Vibrio barjaei]|uniref:hypothetical protein n=1 Tax=Vibrio barjaei TaxID=1676683 RepID=UPI002284AC2B|nr:hypothetical protein [Vibrio barjaei]MCY9870465.1 hypothetical protein [Vibrio barjaei]